MSLLYFPKIVTKNLRLGIKDFIRYVLFKFKGIESNLLNCVRYKTYL